MTGELIWSAKKLDKFPAQSVVLDGLGRASQMGADGLWYRAGGQMMYIPGRTSERVLRYGSVTVIHDPSRSVNRVTRAQVEQAALDDRLQGLGDDAGGIESDWIVRRVLMALGMTVEGEVPE